MKIAYLSTFYPFKGGIAKFNSSLVNELLILGHEVDVYTFTTQYPSFLVKNQYAKVKYENDVEGRRILSTINPFSWLQTTKEINKFAPDILIMKYWVPQLAPSLGFVYRHLNKKTKVISIIDNVTPHESHLFDNLLNKYFLKKQYAFITMSNEVRNDLLFVNKNANVISSPHPLYDYGKKINRAEALKTIKMKPDKKTLLFFGLIRDYKGLDLLINAFSMLSDDYQLIIAGECRKGKEYYEKLILESKNQNIKFINGFIPDDQVYLYFSSADVCVLPYRSATQSGITAIAYHYEIPLIATNVGGLPETITKDDSGMIAEELTEDSLLQTIKRFFTDNKQYHYIENIRKAKSELTWQRLAKLIIEL